MRMVHEVYVVGWCVSHVCQAASREARRSSDNHVIQRAQRLIRAGRRAGAASHRIARVKTRQQVKEAPAGRVPGRNSQKIPGKIYVGYPVAST